MSNFIFFLLWYLCLIKNFRNSLVCFVKIVSIKFYNWACNFSCFEEFIISTVCKIWIKDLVYIKWGASFHNGNLISWKYIFYDSSCIMRVYSWGNRVQGIIFIHQVMLLCITYSSSFLRHQRSLSYWIHSCWNWICCDWFIS